MTDIDNWLITSESGMLEHCSPLNEIRARYGRIKETILFYITPLIYCLIKPDKVQRVILRRYSLFLSVKACHLETKYCTIYPMTNQNGRSIFLIVVTLYNIDKCNETLIVTTVIYCTFHFLLLA